MRTEWTHKQRMNPGNEFGEIREKSLSHEERKILW